MRTTLSGLTLPTLLATADKADEKVATVCATSQTSSARQIYVAVPNANVPAADLGRTARQRNMALVRAGRILTAAASVNAAPASHRLETSALGRVQ